MSAGSSTPYEQYIQKNWHRRYSSRLGAANFCGEMTFGALDKKKPGLQTAFFF